MLKASELFLGTSSFEDSNLNVFYSISTKELSINSEVEFSRYSIYSIDGKLIKKGNLNSTSTIDVSYISNGNYILILNNTFTSNSVKFLKY
jgi:hypothetical protein